MVQYNIIQYFNQSRYREIYLHDSINSSVVTIIFLFLEIARIQRGGKPPGRDTRIVDIYHEKPIRLSVRVIVPVKEHPKFNFVGKLLGPKGNSMKRLQEDTMTKMAVLGKGSMRNKQQVSYFSTKIVIRVVSYYLNFKNTDSIQFN